ncbi:plasmid recombination protein [Faecalibacterium prausnitzii]|uniref:Plasmid recombination enzyme n=1 Tax=Faecalibacterium prausnitzii TaxID=853 RepID=A0A564UHB6_9FIRM|nr:plasmid recombination protein [Faecalibacterium prausnitzii]VUX18938.1 Plasmid recombination enzyme [Faecalibacterium prausnitzii]
MARNDGIDRTSVRNLAVSDKAVGNTQQHNEREKDSYRNPDILPHRTEWNVHFKKPTASYTDLFAQMEAAGTISTRGLKPDATHYCELIFDVNSAYFDNHGGYEFAKQFYADAYKAAVQIVGGEQYILSAVMHADEINRAMTEALGREVYHYHLHVVYVPVVKKQILWSKRCKDKALIGTVKETVMQVSRSKKWASKPLLDDAGKPVLQKNGKPVLKKSYSVLQDDFFHYMRTAGYTDVERGERGSTEEHLTVTQFKVQREQERLDSLTAQIDQKEQHLTQTNKTLSKTEKELAAIQKKAAVTKDALIHAQDMESLGKRTLLGNYSLTEDELSALKKQAAHGYVVDVENRQLKQQLAAAKRDCAEWQARYRDLRNDVQPYLNALRHAPERVRNFFENLLSQKPERTASIPKDRHHEQNAEL